MKLRITILKYHSWYLCQISLQIMLLPILIAWFVRDILHKNHSWYFTIVSNFTRTNGSWNYVNNFEISLMVFKLNMTTDHAITYTNLKFHIWSYKIAMATFITSQCQNGDEVLKCYEWRCQGIKRQFREPKQTKEYIEEDSNRYFVEQFWKFST